MTDKIEELIERLRANADPNCHQHIRGLSADAAEALSALRTQRDEVIEECATVASEMGDAWHREWRAGLKASTHLEGKSDGADEIAAAIRNLKREDEPR